jgi:hypothetical protein
LSSFGNGKAADTQRQKFALNLLGWTSETSSSAVCSTVTALAVWR